MEQPIITHTLGEMRKELEALLSRPDETIVTFGAGDLRWLRIKNRGPVEGPAIMNFELGTLYTVIHQL